MVVNSRSRASAGRTKKRLRPDSSAKSLSRRLDEQGDRTGTTLALESGLDSGAKLAAFLERFDTAGLGVSYDPGNMLVNGFDPYASLRALRGKLVLCHARDARRAGASRAAAEVPVGHGDLDWLQLLGIFEEIEYRGWLTVKREEGADKLADVAGGMAFLRRIVGPG